MFCTLHSAGPPEALVALARDCSPRVEVVCPELVVFDARGLGRLLGEAPQIGDACRRLALERQLTVAIALAGTRTAALLLALAQPSVWPAGVIVARPGDEAAALASLPLSLLATLAAAEAPVRPAAARPRRRPRPGGRGSGRHYRLAPVPGAADPPTPTAVAGAALGRRSTRETPAALDGLADLLEMLHRWGLRTLGDLAALPPIELFERAGTTGLAWQGVARGEDVRPLVRTLEERPYEATTVFEWPVETLEPLSFVLSRLLEPLTDRLARAGLGTLALQVTLRLVTRELHVRRLALPSPMRDPRMLRTLALLDLESHPPSAGVDQLTVTLAPVPGRILQHSLLTRALPVPEQMATLTARLTAVLGAGRVGAPRLLDTHRPGAFAMRPFDGEMQATTVTLERHPSGERPAVMGGPQVPMAWRRWRLPLPVDVEERRGRPWRVGRLGSVVRGGLVAQAAGPWRSSGEWWGRGGPRAALRGTEDREQGTRDEGRRTKDKEHRTRDEGRRTEDVTAAPWDHDEWDVVLASGAIVCLARDRQSGRWHALALMD